jgi:hypothetical protein
MDHSLYFLRIYQRFELAAKLMDVVQGIRAEIIVVPLVVVGVVDVKD